MQIIQNNFYQIVFNHENKHFQIMPADEGFVVLQSDWFAIHYREKSGQRCEFSGECSNHELEVINASIPNHGQGKQAVIRVTKESSPLECRSVFFLPDKYPFVFWKLKIRNKSNEPLWIRRIEMLRCGSFEEKPIVFKEDVRSKNLAFFTNGWQSWSYTGSYYANQKQKHSFLGFLQNPMVVNPGTPLTKRSGHFSSDFFGVLADRKSHAALLVGFLSQKQHFGSLEVELRNKPFLRLWANGDDARLDIGKEVETDWAVVCAFHADESESLAPYLDAVAREHHIIHIKKPPTGWCSWYHYYQKIDGRVIAENLNASSSIRDRLPLNVVQIDDGFQKQVGDWFNFIGGFPYGVAPLAKQIKAAGFTAGLWLAPFIIQRKSRLFHEHPDWILRDWRKRPVNAGFVWNSLGTALDLTNSHALDYACNVVDTAVHDWGFPYLKLDFLYAAALKGLYQDETKTRAQVLRKGMESLRRAAGKHATLVGCGAPLGSVIGLVDAMRIGADVNGTWKPKYFNVSFPFKKERCMPSARNSIQNILTRVPLHNRWWVNDPDCLLLQSSTELTISEVQSLATAIALTGGSLMFSNNLSVIEKEDLHFASMLFPQIGKRASVLDWLVAETPRLLRLDLTGAVGEWHLLARFNWEDRPVTVKILPEEFNLQANDYWVSDFWSKNVYMSDVHSCLFNGEIPSHGVELLAVRTVLVDQPQYIGSNVHISQGLEIVNWAVKKNELLLTVDIERKAKGKLLIALPYSISQVTADGKLISCRRYVRDIYQIPVAICKKLHLRINY